MTSRPMSQCVTCVHYRSPFSRTDGDFEGGSFCAAFPAGIPAEVYGNTLDHRQPIEGDNGVRWTSTGEAYPEYARLPRG